MGTGMKLMRIAAVAVGFLALSFLVSYAIIDHGNSNTIVQEASSPEVADQLAAATPEKRYVVALDVEQMGVFAIELPNGVYNAAIIWPDGSIVKGYIDVRDGSITRVVTKPGEENLETRAR